MELSVVLVRSCETNPFAMAAIELHSSDQPIKTTQLQYFMLGRQWDLLRHQWFIIIGSKSRNLSERSEVMCYDFNGKYHHQVKSELYYYVL